MDTAPTTTCSRATFRGSPAQRPFSCEPSRIAQPGAVDPGFNPLCTSVAVRSLVAPMLDVAGAQHEFASFIDHSIWFPHTPFTCHFRMPFSHTIFFTCHFHIPFSHAFFTCLFQKLFSHAISHAIFTCHSQATAPARSALGRTMRPSCRCTTAASQTCGCWATSSAAPPTAWGQVHMRPPNCHAEICITD